MACDGPASAAEGAIEGVPSSEDGAAHEATQQKVSAAATRTDAARLTANRSELRSAAIVAVWLTLTIAVTRFAQSGAGPLDASSAGPDRVVVEPLLAGTI